MSDLINIDNLTDKIWTLWSEYYKDGDKTSQEILDISKADILKFAEQQANGQPDNHEKALPIRDVSQRSEQLAIAALDKIAHPIKYLQNEAEKDGCKLDGYMAIQLTQDANFYQEIADKALKSIANCG